MYLYWKLIFSQTTIIYDAFVLKSFLFLDVETLAKEQNVGIPTMQLILDALTQPIGRDIRDGKVCFI